MKLLYLEDDAGFARRFHGELLSYRAVQWNLLHCRSISEAIERLIEDRYDAVLCDITNGQRSDATLVGRLASVADVPVVAYGETRDIQLALDCVAQGACEYLDKYALHGATAMLRIRMAVERHAAYRRRPPIVPALAVSRATATVGNDAALDDQAYQHPDGSPLEVDELDGDHGGLETAWLTIPSEPPVEVAEPEERSRRRWLVLDDDQKFIQRLQDDLADTHELVRCEDLERLSELAAERWDAIVLDTSEGSVRGLEALPDVLQVFDEQPVVVISVHDDESTAIHAIQLGAEDYLLKANLSAEELREAVAKAEVRRERAAAAYLARLQQGVVDRRQASRGQDRRVASRYLLTRPVLAIPMLPNQYPDESGQTEAVTVDISMTGLSMLIPHSDRLPSHHWVIGIEAETQRLHFVSCELRNVAVTPSGQRLGLRFLVGERDLLSEENLVPQLNPVTFRLETRHDPLALRRWEKLGVVVHRPWNRVRVCPDCQAVVATSCGCRECGSPHLLPTRLIHHFACAHIGFAEDFDQQGQVACPKCRTKSLVVGADYEILDGPYRCQDCGYQGTERVLAANCLACELRFPWERAVDLELMAYDVERLDTLAFLDAAR